MVGRVIAGAICFLFVAYAAWWIAWYAGTQSSGSPLPEPPYANVIAGQKGV